MSRSTPMAALQVAQTPKVPSSILASATATSSRRLSVFAANPTVTPSSTSLLACSLSP
jgi:hypothetical protein